MSRIVLFNKPYGVVSQFTPEGRWRGLREVLPLHGLRVAGRLDADSEGLLVLTDDGGLQHRIAEPRHKLAKIYWAQVEGIPSADALRQLAGGVALADFVTQPCLAEAIDEPTGLWDRDPPIRFRQAIPTSWLKLTLREGKNRQVRRMCAAVGHPVLRLIRYAVGDATLEGLAPGVWIDGDAEMLGVSLATTGPVRRQQRPDRPRRNSKEIVRKR